MNPGHLDADTLELYAFNRISEPELGLVEEHLLICTACQEAWEDVLQEIQQIRDALSDAE